MLRPSKSYKEDQSIFQQSAQDLATLGTESKTRAYQSSHLLSNEPTRDANPSSVYQIYDDVPDEKRAKQKAHAYLPNSFKWAQ